MVYLSYITQRITSKTVNNAFCLCNKHNIKYKFKSLLPLTGHIQLLSYGKNAPTSTERKSYGRIFLYNKPKKIMNCCLDRSLHGSNQEFPRNIGVQILCDSAVLKLRRYSYTQVPTLRRHSTKTDSNRQKVLESTPKISIDSPNISANLVKDKTVKEQILPYLKLMRLDKPIGIYLLFWPCAWSITLGAAATGAPLPEILHALALFGVGSVLMRAAGTTLNDTLDVDIDKQVERTKSRPLVVGEVSKRQAIAFLAAELSCGLAILLQLNWYSVALGASSMILVTTYPLAKRYTNYPQFVLGATFNWGALLGYTAVVGHLDPVVIPLYLGAVAWTVMYDTIYAHQDKEDDARIGIKSTALTFARYTKPALYSCVGIFSGLWAWTGIIGELGPLYYVGLAGATSHAVAQIYTLNTDNREDCARTFKSNTYIGLIMFLAIFGGSIEKYINNRKKNENAMLSRVDDVTTEHVLK